MENSILDKLRSLLGGGGAQGGPSPGMLGSGMAAHAGDALMTRAYKMYAAQAQSNGDEVVPFEQFQADAMKARRQAEMQGQPGMQQPGIPRAGLGAGGGL